LQSNCRAHSSVGSEHLVYTQGVGGSNPSAPTNKNKSLVEIQDFFYTKTEENMFLEGWVLKMVLALAKVLLFFQHGVTWDI
jgi:hypothetical protein